MTNSFTNSSNLLDLVSFELFTHYPQNCGKPDFHLQKLKLIILYYIFLQVPINLFIIVVVIVCTNFLSDRFVVSWCLLKCF